MAEQARPSLPSWLPFCDDRCISMTALARATKPCFRLLGHDPNIKAEALRAPPAVYVVATLDQPSHLIDSSVFAPKTIFRVFGKNFPSTIMNTPCPSSRDTCAGHRGICTMQNRSNSQVHVANARIASGYDGLLQWNVNKQHPLYGG